VTVDVLRGEPLVLVVVTADDHIYAAGVEGSDQGI
jgi:hypothetical protein